MIVMIGKTNQRNFVHRVLWQQEKVREKKKKKKKKRKLTISVKKKIRKKTKIQVIRLIFFGSFRFVLSLKMS